jgi:hypothetical protein
MKFKVSGQHTHDYIITAENAEAAFAAHIENEAYYAIANNGQAEYGTIDDVLSCFECGGFAIGQMEIFAKTIEEAYLLQCEFEFNWACSTGNHPDPFPIELITQC